MTKTGSNIVLPVLLQFMPNKKSTITSCHLLSMYKPFNGENSNLIDLRTLQYVS